jgi:hypothetical protein
LNRATLNGLELGTQATGVGTYEISNGSLSILANLGVGVAGQGQFKVIGDDAIISVGGSYSQSALSTVHFDIADSVSAIDVAGNVALNGTLDVQFGTQPQYGDEFVLMNYGGQLTGAFSTFQTLVDGPLGPGSIEVALNYGAGADSVLTITVVPEPHTAVLLGSALLLAATVRHGARYPSNKIRNVT